MGILTQKLRNVARAPKGLIAEKLELSTANANKSRVSQLLNSRNRTYIDVYHRPTFNRILLYDSASTEAVEFAAEYKCKNVKTTGIKREYSFKSYDFDDWSDEEIKDYDAKFEFTPINDEVSDILFMEVPGIEKDALELEDFVNEAEFDISYGSAPEFLPEIIKEAPVAEETVELALEETVETAAVEEVVLSLEEPKVAGLLAAATVEEAEAVCEAVPVIEEVVQTVEEEVACEAVPVLERTVFSVGFGTVSAANVGETVFSFGFGFEEAGEEEVEISTVTATVDNGVFASPNSDGNSITL